MNALENNKKQNLNLTTEQLDYLIKNSDLKQVNNWDESSLMNALENNKKKKLNLTLEQWKYLIENSDLSLLNEKKLLELKKIQSELINKEILAKINIKEYKIKVNKI